MTGSDSRLRLAALLILLAASVAVLAYSWHDRERRSSLEICRATDAGEWSRALELSEELERIRPAGEVAALGASALAAVECRCVALLATGDGPRCEHLLEDALHATRARSGTGWTPRPELSIHLIQTWRDAGRSDDAARLARRAAARHPDDPTLFFLELTTRSVDEDEASVLAELEDRVAERGGLGSARMRVSLANRYLLRSDASRALAVLGAAPAREDPATPQWYETRGMALASVRDVLGVQRSYERWLAAGGRESDLLLRYAVTLSIAELADPDETSVGLLRRAIRAAEADPDAVDPVVFETAVVRLVLTLVAAGEYEEALVAFREGRERFDLAGLDGGELERSSTRARSDRRTAERRRGSLRFEIAEPGSRWQLLVSPDVGAPADARYEPAPVPSSGRLTLERAIDATPQRWVLRDRDEQVLASGTVRPRADEEVRIAPVTRRPAPRADAALSRRPADGRTRVALLLLDCMDWRIVQYLRARGELPVTDALARAGYRAVLHSDPPLTAAALQSLVWPAAKSSPTVLGVIHQLGTQLAGLASVGENPLAGLRWLLPERDDLFSTLGAGPYQAANLLFSHGGIQAGRHSEVTGPDGRRRRVPIPNSARDLTPEERERWPSLADVDERDAVHLRTIAAELDQAEAILAAGEIDLLVLRVEPLDILTHAHFAQSVLEGQDDANGLLFDVYRYLDARVGDVHTHLDADDVLIVMSDHGIRTAMEHSPDAVFIAAGPGIPHGRAPDRPDFRGVPKVLADVLRIPVAWPDAGIAPWASRVAEVPALAQRTPHEDGPERSGAVGDGNPAHERPLPSDAPGLPAAPAP